MMSETASTGTNLIDPPAWNLRWLTPVRCRIIFVFLLALGFFSHLRYLHVNCPIDLLGDEAQYWDWSRSLDWSYYSKGPLVALIIRASCSVFGDTMPAVRYPALVLGVGTSIFFYLTAKKLSGSERVALGTVVLTYLVPMFIAGSVLMTIDPPYFFCWAVATYCAVLAIFENKRWAWIVAGLFIGVGFLAKYAALLWWVGILSFLLLNRRRDSENDDRSAAVLGPSRFLPPVLGAVVSLLFTIPVIIWNHQHDWVTFRHVARQTGAKGGGLSQGNLLEFIGGQIGVVGPTLAILMIAAVWWAQSQPKSTQVTQQRGDRNHWWTRLLDSRVQRQSVLWKLFATIIGNSLATIWLASSWLYSKLSSFRDSKTAFLTILGVFFLGLNCIDSLFVKVQQNWPAPAYFTLIILTALFLADRLQSIYTWKRWRGLVWMTVGLGMTATPILHDISILFPIAVKFKVSAEKLDFTTKARGWKQLGEFVTQKSQEMGTNPFILCDDYLQTAEMAFYVKGQPKTYYAGSYFADAKRMTQYDLWPDRSLSDPALIGRDAIYVGKGGDLPPDIPAAFERMSEKITLPIYARGVEAKSFKIWLCYGYKGMHRPGKTDY